MIQKELILKIFIIEEQQLKDFLDDFTDEDVDFLIEKIKKTYNAKEIEIE